MADIALAPAPDAAIGAAGFTPVFAAVSTKSGGGMGRLVLESLVNLLEPANVFDLFGPEAAMDGLGKQLQLWSDSVGKRAHGTKPRLLACGGDGTVGWIIGALAERGLLDAFAVATVPLGTANDWARVMGWSNTYYAGIESTAVSLLRGAVGAKNRRVQERRFDVWKLEQWATTTAPPDQSVRGDMCIWPFEVHGQHLREIQVLNYFSIGYDAKVAFEFEQWRSSRLAQNKQSRCRNMVCYLGLGCKNLECFCCGARPLSLVRMRTKVLLDGVEVSLCDNWHSLALNTNSIVAMFLSADKLCDTGHAAHKGSQQSMFRRMQMAPSRGVHLRLAVVCQQRNLAPLGRSWLMMAWLKYLPSQGRPTCPACRPAGVCGMVFVWVRRVWSR